MANHVAGEFFVADKDQHWLTELTLRDDDSFTVVIHHAFRTRPGADRHAEQVTYRSVDHQLRYRIIAGEIDTSAMPTHLNTRDLAVYELEPSDWAVGRPTPESVTAGIADSGAP